MKKEIAKLFLQCSQPLATVPHLLFCEAHNILEEHSDELGPLGELFKNRFKGGCPGAEDEVHENHAVNPAHISAVRFEVHPKNIKGIYAIKIRVMGEQLNWIYTDREAFDIDKHWFEERIGSVAQLETY